MNIPRYVDNFEKEEEVDINALLTQMDQTDKELEQAQGEFLSLLKDLTSTDETIMSSLNELIREDGGVIAMGKPKIRFKGYEDDWEQRKVTDLGEIYIGLVTKMTEHYTDKGHLLI